LGRGLDALLSGDVASDLKEGDRAVSVGADNRQQTHIDEVAIESIVRGRYQPRLDFNEETLAELAASIKAQGVMQPVVVRARAQGGYELVAGERRWRAAQMAGLSNIPAVVRDVTDEQASAMALIENIQREDLNPLEEAQALQRLKEEFDLTQQQVADAVGKSRVAVTNLLRLLNLEAPVRDMLLAGSIEMGHARALLSLDPIGQERIANEVATRQLSVRQTEALVRQIQAGKPAAGRAVAKDADTRRLEQDITEKIGAPVTITFNAKGKGQLVIRYTSLDELEGILKHLSP
jgi:ParB family chromosome partitioning protein